MNNFRNAINNHKLLAFGCSHTYGTGVEVNETWSYHLSAMNFGVQGCSTDLIARILPDIALHYMPDTILILWPMHLRFEYIKHSIPCQSLPSDKNRIEFMAIATDDWLMENFNNQVSKIKDFCLVNNIRLVSLTLEELTPYIDHADVWPKSKLGHHYNEEWHKWVADIFAQYLYNS